MARLLAGAPDPAPDPGDPAGPTAGESTGRNHTESCVGRAQGPVQCLHTDSGGQVRDRLWGLLREGLWGGR